MTKNEKQEKTGAQPKWEMPMYVKSFQNHEITYKTMCLKQMEFQEYSNLEINLSLGRGMVRP